jgi:hypothetical protein
MMLKKANKICDYSKKCFNHIVGHVWVAAEKTPLQLAIQPVMYYDQKSAKSNYVGRCPLLTASGKIYLPQAFMVSCENIFARFRKRYSLNVIEML